MNRAALCSHLGITVKLTCARQARHLSRIRNCYVVKNAKSSRIVFSVCSRGYGSYRERLLDRLQVLEEENLSSNQSVIDVQKRSLHDIKNTGRGSFEDELFKALSDDQKTVGVNRFITELRTSGLRQDDPRLERCIHKMQEHADTSKAVSDVLLDKEAFTSCIRENLVIITRAFMGDFVIPEFPKFCEHIKKIYWDCRTHTGGKVASYIPQLSRYSPDYWGASICTVDGQRYSLGDVKVPFCLQSVSKPLAYGLALDERGCDTFHQFVGQEPSGVTFNAIALDPTNKPHNPMINAGAIVTASLLRTNDRLAERFEHVSKQFKRMAGRDFIGFNNSVFLSERETADRNFALGYYLKEKKCFPHGVNIVETLDFYFQMCSVEVDCDSASVIGATLANGGICPLTGEKIFSADAIRNILSLMHSCGMYDYSGQFAFKVGLPAKSGVSGAIILVVPNVMGICVWSPPLDSCGNSVRGLQFSESLVNEFNFHQFDNLEYTYAKHDPRKSSMGRVENEVTTLLYGAYNGDIVALRRMALSGCDMGRSDYDGRTALHLAAAEGHVDCVRFLLRANKVDAQPKDRWDRTPYDDALQYGHTQIAEYINKFIGNE